MDFAWLVRILLEISLIICLHVLSSQSYESIVVSTKYGQIQGESQGIPLAQGPIKRIHKFLGIPYAQAPVKELRFQPPRPHKGWKPKLFNARQFGNICQHSKTYLAYLIKSIRPVWPGFTYENVNEDCLTLNIYTPATVLSPKPNNSLYPVLFYIHGGSFLLGTPARDKTIGDVLPSYGIILVTIQYRLGPFGFITTGDAAAPGNYGLLDQVEALKWVNENIAQFGGDKKRITIAGNSAGGASVGLHLMSPMTKGLFQGAIMESGVELSPFAFLPLEEAVQKTKNVGRKLLCDTENSTTLIECLRSKDASDISFYYEKFPAPVLDNYYLTDTPENLRKKKLFHRVPVIIGFTKHEGHHNIRALELESPLNDNTFRKGIERSIQELFDIQEPMVAQQMADALEFQYYPWYNIGNAASLMKGLVKMLTDYYIIAPSFKAADFHSRHSKTYLFHYQYLSSARQDLPWVYHGRNVDYSFGGPFTNMSYDKFDDKDRNISHFIMSRYANFAKYGTPDPLSGDLRWTAYTPDNGAYLDVTSQPEIAYKYHPNRMAFWNHYVPKMKKGSCSMPPTMDATTSGGRKHLPSSSIIVLLLLLISFATQPLGLL
ncbi:cholinesterase 2-like [Actinia tenebrosa]|uniref:Carboxylic ester hydrolase n=1 Tax=Actinia tenebrosa TaxID=6105 RepID=A0A6P8I6D1_ACTTE|nr:cholinesterase 2-like [Actinia tenebrosa]